jgi:beta-xylosidase
MIDSVMFWNEPNNKSHWDPALDPGWARFAAMARMAGHAVAEASPGLTRVMGGMSPIDPGFVVNLAAQGGLDEVDVVAVHGFPLDWNLWSIHDWPAKVAEIEAATALPVWVSEVGVGSFGAEEVQAFGVQRTAELLVGRVPRAYWYSLLDLPRAWGRHHAPQGGGGVELLPPLPHGPDPRGRHAETLASTVYAAHARPMGLMQWFHFEDPRLDGRRGWMKRWACATCGRA